MLKSTWVLLLAVMYLCAPLFAFAGINAGQAFSIWPDTGQTTCYDDAGNILNPCPAPGQPFYGQDAQYAGPARSYTVLGGGTMVQDNVTGLIWERKEAKDGTPDYSNPHDADNTYTWCDTDSNTNGGNQGTCGTNDTEDFLAALNSGSGFAGHTDWRIPTYKELLSLVDYSRWNPSISTSYFSATDVSSYYWTSSTYSWLSTSANKVGFYDGTVGTSAISKSTSYYVRAVRGGQPEIQVFEVNNDGTVTDTTTCLQWQQETADTTGDNIPDAMNLQDALNYTESLTLGGYADWRLPNINELLSLSDYSRNYPAIDSSVFSGALSSEFCSSTTVAKNLDARWLVAYHYGESNWNSKSSPCYVRAVRGQQCGALGYSAYLGRIYQAPMSGTPGTTFNEGGTGFTPNSTVTLQFRNHLGQMQAPFQVATDASGAFSLQYTAPADKPIGTHTWWAVDDTTGNMSAQIGYLIYEQPSQQTLIDKGTIPVLPPVEVDLGFGQLTSQGAFDPTKETFVIIHGWNGTDSNALPSWVQSMGITIQSYAKSPAQGANVLYWNWQEEAKSSYGIGVSDDSCVDIPTVPFDKTENSGKYLAVALLKGLPKIYNQDIHFIGHSLGTLVSTYAAKYSKKHNLFFANLITHIVYLDSPCWGIGNVPGGKFLHDNKDTIFFENYVSDVGVPYRDADVNVWLIKASEWLLFEAHSYPYYWYTSSVRNFDDQILEPQIPSSTMHWGFYWWAKANRSGSKPFYSQTGTGHHYYLAEGFPSSADVNIERLKILTGMIIDTGKAYKDASADILTQLGEYADWAVKKVTILGANTFNTAARAAGYITDVAGHAMYDAMGYLTLTHSSTAVLSMPVDIPVGANALSFGVEFLSAAPSDMLEVFLNDIPMQHLTSDRALGEGIQLMPWMNVEPFAGQQVTLTLRLSNPNPDTEGEIRIDDLVVAKIEDNILKFPWTMFLPAITGAGK